MAKCACEVIDGNGNRRATLVANSKDALEEKANAEVRRLEKEKKDFGPFTVADCEAPKPAKKAAGDEE